MIWYKWITIITLAICSGSFLVHLARLIRSGKPIDYSRKKGNTGGSVRYAFTGAMSPTKKESAYLHLPTYTAGLIYHFGTFLSFILLFFLIAGEFPTGIVNKALAILFGITGVSGFSILIKRILKKQLRTLSNPDDYLSNFIVSSIQVITALFLIFPVIQPVYYLAFSLLFLYMPLGKLRHTVYFFAARYHLGMFYGWRGVWPPKSG